MAGFHGFLVPAYMGTPMVGFHNHDFNLRVNGGRIREIHQIKFLENMPYMACLH